MIYLITGLPGNGKTLYTLWHIRERAKEEQRPVFYSGIPDLNIPEWQECDADKWFDCPPGSIIIIDEAQRVFRPRPGRGAPPDYVERLETHRHDGLDLYLITQHPSLIDQNVRRLAGTHRHIVRTFGMNRSVIHEWGEVHLDCERRREDSSKTTWNFPKDVFSLYKSAEVHTHKRSFPKQVYYLIALLVILAAIFAWLFLRVDELTSKPDETAPIATASGAATAPAVVGPSFSNSAPRPPRTRSQFLSDHLPRVDGYAHTAPEFDAVTTPVRAPYPVGCTQVGNVCRCYSQDRSVLPMPPEVCRATLEQGFFRSWSLDENPRRSMEFAR